MAGATSNTVNKLQPSDGTILGTYHAGIGPSELAFDGVHIWDRFLIQSYYYRPVRKRWGAQATIELDSATG